MEQLENKPAKELTYYPSLNSVRGLATLLVLWSHLSGYWLSSNGKSSVAQTVWTEAIVRPFHLNGNGGHLGVALFFILSGFLSANMIGNAPDRAEFVKKRIARIIPGILLAVCLSYIYSLICSRFGWQILGLSELSLVRWLLSPILLDWLIGGMPIMVVTWTLINELFFYLMLVFLLPFLKKDHRKYAGLLIVLWVFFVLAIPRRLLGNVIYVGLIILGFQLYFALFDAKNRAIYIIRMVSTGALMVALFEHYFPGVIFAAGVEPALSYVYAVAIVSLAALNKETVLAPLNLIGYASYSIYLIHIPMGMTVQYAMSRISDHYTLNTIIAISVTIGIAYLLTRYYEGPVYSKLITKRRRIL